MLTVGHHDVVTGIDEEAGGSGIGNFATGMLVGGALGGGTE